MSDGSLVVTVAVPRPLHGFFTYRIKTEWAKNLKPRDWVTVPFGNSETHAFVVEAPKPISELSSDFPVDKLKDVLAVGDPADRISEEIFELCKWAADYYLSPLGEVLNCAFFQITGKPRTIKPFEGEHEALVLSSAQDEVLKKILLHLKSEQGPRATLLEGVTGSGKTEIYIELAREVLRQGKSVLVLVPEIALTPQLYQRFEKRLGTAVGVWHSALAEGRKRDLISAMRSGDLKILVGARSALFAPLQNIGLIIIDEEHDPTYKQEDRVRYHARDLALVRAKISHAKVLLGSATPSLESLERVREGKYYFAELKERLGKSTLPQIDIVNLAEEERVEKLRAPFATRTLEEIQKVLSQGDQVMVYLNRRGFAAFLVCEDCGWVKGCPKCSISLTLHKRPPMLCCHVCGHQEKPVDACENCQGSHLLPLGAGTESLEEELPHLLEGAKVLRLDRDQITSMSRLEKALETFRSGECNLLLGTQMLVKGHDFPNVTLVVVVLADALFRWPDFRAPERALQVLTQVSGRAGRAEKPGRVLVQTFQPEHPVLAVLQNKQSVKEFLDSERELRQLLNYPPFGRLALLRVESEDQKEAISRANILAQALAKNLNGGVDVMGPSEAFLERAKGIYRWDILLKSQKIDMLQRAIAPARAHFQKQKWKLTIDVDPYGIH